MPDLNEIACINSELTSLVVTASGLFKELEGHYGRVSIVPTFISHSENAKESYLDITVWNADFLMQASHHNDKLRTEILRRLGVEKSSSPITLSFVDDQTLTAKLVSYAYLIYGVEINEVGVGDDSSELYDYIGSMSELSIFPSFSNIGEYPLASTLQSHVNEVRSEAIELNGGFLNFNFWSALQCGFGKDIFIKQPPFSVLKNNRKYLQPILNNPNFGKYKATRLMLELAGLYGFDGSFEKVNGFFEVIERDEEMVNPAYVNKDTEWGILTNEPVAQFDCDGSGTECFSEVSCHTQTEQLLHNRVLYLEDQLNKTLDKLAETRDELRREKMEHAALLHVAKEEIPPLKDNDSPKDLVSFLENASGQMKVLLEQQRLGKCASADWNDAVSKLSKICKQQLEARRLGISVSTKTFR